MTHHKLIEDAVLTTQEARARGSAYRLEVGYPVYCSEGEEVVHGEVVELKNLDVIWPLLDQFFMYKESKAEKCVYLREIVKVQTAQGEMDVYTYGLNPLKKPKSAQEILNARWRDDFAAITPLTEELTLEEATYIKKLGQCTGREIVPYTPLTRILEKRGFVIDKGRRPALTKLGKELFQFLL